MPALYQVDEYLLKINFFNCKLSFKYSWS